MTEIRQHESSVLSANNTLQLAEIKKSTENDVHLLAISDPLCIHQILEEYAKNSPDSVAVVDGEEHVTYWELNIQANQIAHHLQYLGIKRGQPIGLYMQQSVRTVQSMLGVLKSGGAYVPMDTRYPLARIKTILEEARITVILTQKALSVALDNTVYTLVSVDEDWDTIAQESQDNPQNEASECDLAYIIFTSGTTGKPKGVEIEHRSLRNLINWHRRAFHTTAHDRAMLLASIAFDASVWELWPYLCSGASVSIVPTTVHDSLSQLQTWIIDHAITICFLPTPLAEQVITLAWPSAISLRILLTGGDLLHTYPPASLPFIFVNNYGPTENTVVATSYVVPSGPETEKLPSIGKPITNVNIYILDEQLKPVPAYAVGEIYIAGASLARGYHNQPQLTQERFLPHPFSSDPTERLYKTGDLAHWNADDTLAFLGRNDQQVKIRGFRIELGEIDTRLEAHAAVSASCSVAVPLSNDEKQLVTFFVPKEHRHISVDELRAHLEVVLPDYMIPTRLVQLNKLPLTTSGKVDRQQLVDMETSQKMPQEVLVTANETEQLLVEIWHDLLKGRQFGLHDDFFKLGTHSLSVLQLIVRIRTTFNVNLTVKEIFQASTIVTLSVLVQDKQLAKKVR